MGRKSEILIFSFHIVYFRQILIYNPYLKITDQSNCTQEFDPVLTCKHDGDSCSVLQILLKIALKLQIGKDYDKKEQEYQKYIYYASNEYQYYGESGQDTDTKLF